METLHTTVSVIEKASDEADQVLALKMMEVRQLNDQVLMTRDSGGTGRDGTLSVVGCVGQGSPQQSAAIYGLFSAEHFQFYWPHVRLGASELQGEHCSIQHDKSNMAYLPGGLQRRSDSMVDVATSPRA